MYVFRAQNFHLCGFIYIFKLYTRKTQNTIVAFNSIISHLDTMLLNKYFIYCYTYKKNNKISFQNKKIKLTLQIFCANVTLTVINCIQR